MIGVSYVVKSLVGFAPELEPEPEEEEEPEPAELDQGEEDMIIDEDMVNDENQAEEVCPPIPCTSSLIF